ncbi:5-oxoprolinase subunit PxpA [Halalkalibacter alkalisediminis]|uniref:5-oxoprolinase subunit A n=1 Tax=Halalkalibacter alkalisediminis TaxID=935616 RepID=A0ABV6NHK5_9BACI|nr:5-oxoprolinase subunit PxpA [Halalkalibacter alkalisediminis]
MKSVDLNCDLGESFGTFVVGQDKLILEHITSANIACGYHAGDHNVMSKTVKMAKEKGVSIGAHPGFPDLLGFGRRVIQTDPTDIYHFVVYQISALKGFCQIHDVDMNHVKPHGALYNVAAKDPLIAEAIAKAVYDTDRSLVLFGLSGSELIKAGSQIGLTVANEVFADRTYQPDGTLTPRTHNNALIHNIEEAVEQVLTMVKTSTVLAVDGSIIPLQADTICVHGDGPSALDFAKKLQEVLVKEGVKICEVKGRNTLT